jgi:DNA-binding phage protein
MAEPRTAAERYLAERRKDPEYEAEYVAARERISRVDAFVRSLDARRQQLGLSKAELGRAAGVKPEAVRRLFTGDGRNPTLGTVVALANALDMDIVPVPRAPDARTTSRRVPRRHRQRGSGETHLRTA